MAHCEKISFKMFRERFQTEDSCRDFLFRQKWPNGFVCPKCGGHHFYEVRHGRGVYQCAHCRHQTSLTANTAMHRTHLPLTTWFWAIFLMGSDKRGISAVNLSEKLDICYESAWCLLRRIRAAMAEKDADYMLSGIVEFDDTYFGATSEGGKRGRGTAKTSVLVALSKDEKGKPQFLKMQVVADLKSATIGDFAMRNIRPGATVQSDAFGSYRKPLGESYDHQFEVYRSDSEMLKWLHTIIGNAKAFVNGTFHGLAAGGLQRYLDEFCYRFNRRFFQQELFARLLTAVAAPLYFGVG